MANKYLENYLNCVGSKERCNDGNDTITSWRVGKVSTDFDFRVCTVLEYRGLS